MAHEVDELDLPDDSYLCHLLFGQHTQIRFSQSQSKSIASRLRLTPVSLFFA